MKNVPKLFIKVLILLIAFAMNTNPAQAQNGHYADVNGLHLYYEIHGSGEPLVLIHGGGSTIYTTFAKTLPLFAQKYKVIAVELQAHGHTKDIDRPLSFAQDADDIAALLKQLHIQKASFFGFSNGGSTALQIAIRHPQLVSKVVALSALIKRDGIPAPFWDAMNAADLNNMPKPLQDAYLQIINDRAGLLAMFNRDRIRMQHFEDWNQADIRHIQAPVLVMSSDQDVIRPEHTVEIFRLLPHARLAILPGLHGECIGEITTPQDDKTIAATVYMIECFLDNGK